MLFRSAGARSGTSSVMVTPPTRVEVGESASESEEKERPEQVSLPPALKGDEPKNLGDESKISKKAMNQKE